VTFLFTDVEGSTSRWEKDADAMRVALVAHDEVLRARMILIRSLDMLRSKRAPSPHRKHGNIPL
jgi:hypothetical protein